MEDQDAVQGTTGCAFIACLRMISVRKRFVSHCETELESILDEPHSQVSASEHSFVGI